MKIPKQLTEPSTAGGVGLLALAFPELKNMVTGPKAEAWFTADGQLILPPDAEPNYLILAVAICAVIQIFKAEKPEPKAE